MRRGQGHEPRSTGASRSREKQGHGFSPRASGGRNLPTPRFQPRETRVGPLPAGTQRRGDKFVLSSATRLGQLVRGATGSPRGRAEGGGRRAVPPSLGLEVPGAVSSSSSGLRRSPPGLHRAGRSEPPTLLTCQPLLWAPGRQTDTQAPERRWRWPPTGHTSHLSPGPKDPPTPLPGGLSTS